MEMLPLELPCPFGSLGLTCQASLLWMLVMPLGIQTWGPASLWFLSQSFLEEHCEISPGLPPP